MQNAPIMDTFDTDTFSLSSHFTVAKCLRIKINSGFYLYILSFTIMQLSDS